MQFMNPIKRMMANLLFTSCIVDTSKWYKLVSKPDPQYSIKCHKKTKPQKKKMKFKRKRR